VYKLLSLFLLIFIAQTEVLAVDHSLPLPGPVPSAQQIAEQVYFVDHFYAFDNLMVGYKKRPKMHLFNYSGKKVSQIDTERMITHRPSKPELKTQDLVIFRSGKLKGTGLLVDDFKQLTPMQVKMWLPALRKIRRFSEPDQDDIWGGSHLTYGDLYLRRPQHEVHEVVSREEPGFCLEDPVAMNQWIEDRLEQPLTPWCNSAQRELILMKSTPKETSPHYGYRLRWIDPVSFAEYQVEYFKDKQLAKRTQKGWRPAGLDDPRAQVWNFWCVRVFKDDQVSGESIAWVDDDAYQWNVDVNSRLWSERSLRKIRR
jgi:hypothetical protein